MKKKGIIAVLSALCIFLFACAPKPLILTEKDSGKEITVKKGNEIVIKLPSNPTTGFDWEVKEMPDFLKAGDVNVFISSTKDKNVVGAGGTTEFTFKAVEKGEGVLLLVYKRKWEPDIGNKFEIKIKVQ